MRRWGRPSVALLFGVFLLALGSGPGTASSTASDSWWVGTVTYTLTAPGKPDEGQHGAETDKYTFTVAGRIGVATASLKVSAAWRDYNCHVTGADVWNSEEIDLEGDVVRSFQVTASGTDQYTFSAPIVGVSGSRAYVKVVSGCTTESGTKIIKQAIGPQDDLLRGTGNASTDDELSGSLESDACWPYAWLSPTPVLLGECKRTVTWHLERTKKDCNKDRRTGKQHASDAIKDYIKKKEGVGGEFVPYLYNDLSRSYVKPWAKGNCTIGWGHKLHDGPCNLDCKTANEAEYVICEGSDWQGLKPITEQEAKALFDADLTSGDGAERKLNNWLKVPLTQNQFDALVDFVFNAGSVPSVAFWADQCTSGDPSNPRCQDVLFQINCGVFDNVYGSQGGKPVGLSKFNKADGVYLQDLADRRAYEEKLWTGGGNRPEGLAASTGHHALRSLPPPAKPLPKVGPRKARVIVSPHRAPAGKRVVIRGTHFGLRADRCSPTVQLIAFVPAVSPYRAIALGRVDIPESRAFTRAWKTKKFAFRFRWAVVALQKCEGKTLQRRDTVTIR